MSQARKVYLALKAMLELKGLLERRVLREAKVFKVSERRALKVTVALVTKVRKVRKASRETKDALALKVLKDLRVPKALTASSEVSMDITKVKASHLEETAQSKELSGLTKTVKHLSAMVLVDGIH